MPNTSQPLLYVIVINWNGREHLKECFETLLASTYKNLRFVLLDNGSSDDSVDFVQTTFAADERVEILECGENLGWSGGNNVGMQHAMDKGADYVLLLNNDTTIDSHALEHMVAMCEANESIGALSAKLLLYDSPEILNSVGLEATANGSSWDRGIGRLDGDNWQDTGPIIGACGAALFLRVKALDKTGLLPTDFDIYLDDLDLCLRIWNAGYEIRACPEARIHHKFSATMGSGKNARRKYYLNTRNRTRVILRNYPLAQAPVIVSNYVLGECRAIGRAILGGEVWRLLAHLRSWLAGFAYIPNALRERARRRKASIGTCRFWHLVRTDLQFFSGTELPVDGWYAERDVEGEILRPISRVARYAHTGGKLKIIFVNCYPRFGDLHIQILQNGSTLATCITSDKKEILIEPETGDVCFESLRVFSAEDTGQKCDFGGWLRVQPM